MKLLIAKYHRVGDTIPPNSTIINISSDDIYNPKQILVQVTDVLVAFEIEPEK